MDNSVIINKQHLAPVPFVVDGATIKVKDLGGDDLVVMPYSTGATLVRSTELIEFFYQIDDLQVVFTNYDNDADADIDYASLTALMVSMSAGGGGGGAVTIADGADVTFGAKADTAAISDTAVASYMSLFKRLLGHITTLLGYSKPNGEVIPVPHTIGTTAVMVLPAEPNRKSLFVMNGSGAILDIGHDNTVSPTNRTYPQVANGAGANFNDFVPTNEIWIRVRSGSGLVMVTSF